MIALLAVMLLAAPPKPVAASVRVTFMESASRVKVASQTLELKLDAQVATHDLGKGGSLDGVKLKTLAREVTVNDAPGGAWIELTVLAKDGSEAGYLALTIPPGVETTGFSAATKVRSAKKGEELSLVVSRP